jgi:D-3-phosphoglycerate dehydrogenase
MKILFIDTVHPILQTLLEKENHVCVDGSKFSREEIQNNISEYNGIIIRSRFILDESFLVNATHLKFIARAGAGMENIDVKYAESKKIVCINSPEGNRDAVGEQAIGMLLSLFNNINKADKEVREGKWIREGNRGVELKGKTVGIIGYGNTGSAFAKKLSGFECRVIAFDNSPSLTLPFGKGNARLTNMQEIFEQTDILSLHVPLTSETEFLVNDDYINRFAKNIYIINTARGRCLKINDLVKNLKSGKVLGACLDVNEYEDTSFEKSEIENKKSESWNYLVNSERVILTPHIAGWTFESNEKLSRVLFEKIKKQFS